MKIAIIGAGNVGTALGLAWAQKAGHEIYYGLRGHPEKIEGLLRKLGRQGHAGTVEEAAEWGDFIVLATPWPATEAVISAMGNVEGKIILDATNPLVRGPGGPTLDIGHDTSAGEKVQGWARGASVFKTLNSTGFGGMADPVFNGVKSVMFVAGDNPVDKPKVMALVASLGFEVIDAGPLRNARLLEPHAMLWIDLALNRGLGRDWAFSIVRR